MNLIRQAIGLFVVGMLAYGVSGCGNKGKLKSPSQIEAIEAKKARKNAHKQPEYIEDGQGTDDVSDTEQ